VECLFADPDFVLAPEDVDRFLLLVVDVEWRATPWCDLDDEVVEGAAGVLPGDLEDEISSAAGLESQSFVRCEDLGQERCHRRLLWMGPSDWPADILHTRKQIMEDLVHCVK
jgi:hypothetical protein